MRTKAIALISGGLDSLLAARVVMEQGVEVLGVGFVMSAAYTDSARTAASIRRSAQDAGINIRVIDISEEFLELLKDPAHGFGSNVNPCIDCKILMLRKAKEIMEQEKAGFIITGEVLGERPMSQNKTSLKRIKEGSMVGDLLLRPLSARLLDETSPEKEGLVDRERLLGINGRSRKPQLELAEKYGIKDYSAPGASCLLTDPGFARRIRDLLEAGILTTEEVDLLKVGRHFRLDSATKAVVGRTAPENRALRRHKKNGDILLRLEKCSGPDVLLRGDTGEKNINKAAALAVSHSKRKNGRKVQVAVWRGDRDRDIIEADPLPPENIESLRI